MALNKFSRKEASQAIGDIPLKPAKENQSGRSNKRTTVKSFSIRNDIAKSLEDYMFDHRIRSASEVVNKALEAYLKI
ncbi:hypothetical protein I6E06_06170 [Bifidobacterium boum]|uniref:hypothetical protein n=1 Tax=Bifidobacterium boum TaxID=78343 RepID=UPI001F17EF0A|nr:hypothetical protein [Bifidobacterium boum]MCF2562041.1 hypothetical protein [Bifidobacterium boum]